MGSYYGFLNARPSFTEGFVRAVDVGDTLTEYNTSATGEQADYIALTMDWLAIGEDFRHAMASLAPKIEVSMVVNEGPAQKSLWP